jgi:pyrrolidone-carboxylate peptidase
MKLILTISVLLGSFNLWAKPLVLVSYFDAFGKAPFNNSEHVAKALLARFSLPESQVDLKLCALETKYEKAYGQLETCKKELSDAPVMILGLGESTCDLKIEMIMRNKDKTFGPDNGGVERDNTVIIPEAPAAIGMTYPLPQMYCALNSKERKNLNVSNNAGSFVCNNVAFQMSYYYPEISFGFIHVPAQNCRKLDRRTEDSVSQIERMIIAGVNQLALDSMAQRLPVTKAELKDAKAKLVNKDQCLNEFFDRAKTFDKK